MSQPRLRWEEGREPGRQVVVLGAALALTAVAFDLVLSGRLTFFFDLAFVVACLSLALAVRPHDFFTVGVLPPLLMLAAFVLLAVVHPGAIAAPTDGAVQATVSGLAHHSGALVAGYLLCLLTLAVRRRRLVVAARVAARRADLRARRVAAPDGHRGPGQATNRAVSPAP